MAFTNCENAALHINSSCLISFMFFSGKYIVCLYCKWFCLRKLIVTHSPTTYVQSECSLPWSQKPNIRIGKIHSASRHPIPLYSTLIFYISMSVSLEIGFSFPTGIPTSILSVPLYFRCVCCVLRLLNPRCFDSSNIRWIVQIITQFSTNF